MSFRKTSYCCRDCVLLLLYLEKSVIKLLKHGTKMKGFHTLAEHDFIIEIAPAIFCFCLLLLLIIVSYRFVILFLHAQRESFSFFNISEGLRNSMNAYLFLLIDHWYQFYLYQGIILHLTKMCQWVQTSSSIRTPESNIYIYISVFC